MGDVTLVISKTFNASPEEVFRMWTDPIEVAKWYGPEGFTNEIHSFDLREGGEYSLTMKGPDGNGHLLKGTFTTIDAPKKLVFTWQWASGDMAASDGAPTVVTVDIKPMGDTTEMTMTHAGFVDEQTKENHNKGWSSSFVKLEKLLG
jgi:uncharacterized protein YndB with AHSA1/START domain